jgi:hypothetical protein
MSNVFAISLSSCSRYNANFKLDQSVLAIHDSVLYYEISEDDHPRTVTQAGPHITKYTKFEDCGTGVVPRKTNNVIGNVS